MAARFLKAAAYDGDAMELPVARVEEALAFYTHALGFKVEQLAVSPVPCAKLARDEVRIGLAENGGDPEQNGCFFEVDDVAAARADFLANEPGGKTSDFRVEQRGANRFRVFFIIAPDGLCYCLGQKLRD